MPLINVNNVELYHDTFGDPSAPAMLLIMGLGMQATGWDNAFCKLLVSEGFFVIRYDNRDVGLSTKATSEELPNIFAVVGGDTSALEYTLEHLADDAAALLRALHVKQAHVVGASMGGMIAQLLAIRHSEMVLSLASIMSTTGEFGVGEPSAEATESLLQPGMAETKEETIDALMAIHRVVESPDFPLSDHQLRHFVTRDYERSYSKFAAIRQLAAILGAHDRTEELHSVAVPTVVIHGDSDVLVDISGGEATAKAIPGAELKVIKGMGHNMPHQIWPELAALITTNARRT